MSAAGWPVEKPGGSIAERLGSAPDPARRLVLLQEVDASVLVLGSAQEPIAGTGKVEVVRRRSGGGGVLMRPGELLWVDVLVPRGDPLWEDDLGLSALWLGGAWRTALADLGVGGVVYEGPMRVGRWSEQVCFAGTGPGEVLVGGHKVVGISQRRNRLGARFQCAALLAWDPATMVEAFGLEPAQEAEEHLGAVAIGLPVAAEDLTGAFLRALP